MRDFNDPGVICGVDCDDGGSEACGSVGGAPDESDVVVDAEGCCCSVSASNSFSYTDKGFFNMLGRGEVCAEGTGTCLGAAGSAVGRSCCLDTTG